MTAVVISNNEVTNGLGQQYSSTVYHSTEMPCGVTPKPGSPHRVEVDEEIAKAFGRHLCGLCRDTADRASYLTQVRVAVAAVLGGLSLEELAAALPANFELRVMVHGRTKTPKTVWTSRPKNTEDQP